MNVRLGRVRAGEWLIGAGGLALLVILFSVPWYGFAPIYTNVAASLNVPIDYDGWQTLDVIRFLVVLAGVGGLVTLWLQASCRAPALPVCATVLETAVAGVLLIAMIVRVLDHPGGSYIETKWGAYAALGLTFVVALGGYVSLRQDQAPSGRSAPPVELLRLAPRGGSG